VVLADDDVDYLETTRRLLEKEGHSVSCATTAEIAIGLVRSEKPDLLLLDYFFGKDTAEQVLERLREFDHTMQVILQTGYSDEQPPREMLRRLDIQGYHDKADGPDKLLLWAEAGLKAARALKKIDRVGRSQRFILEVTPDLHRVQPLSEFAEKVTRYFERLVLGVQDPALLTSSRVVPMHQAVLAVAEDDAELVVLPNPGIGQRQVLQERVVEEHWERVQNALERRMTVCEPFTLVPLFVGERTIGALYLETPHRAEDSHILQIFTNQVAVALRNAQLYEMAALDPLTGVHARRFFDQWLFREVKTAFRLQQPLSLLMIDMDDMKQINDTAGHLVGDQALALVGRVLREVTRDNDVVGRYGGDEFSIILPREDRTGAGEVAQRIVDRLALTAVHGPSSRLALTSSIGVACLGPKEFSVNGLPIRPEYFQEVAKSLVSAADTALYAVKREGGGAVAFGEAVHWNKPQEEGLAT
jgi:diguanylate cyclase (GGDEF)-like protein